MAEAKDKALAAVIQALGQESFPEALSGFVRVLAAFDNLIIIVYRGEQRPVVLYREFTDPVVYFPMDSEYLGGAYVLDPFYQEHRKGDVRGVRRLLDVAPDQFKRTQYFSKYYRKTTLIDEIAVFANLGGGMTITACIGRDRSSNTMFSAKEIRALTNHESVLSALIENHWQGYQPDQAVDANPLPLGDRLRDVLERENSIQLSPRQAEVAMLILRGHSSLSIGLNLDISTQTVKVFRRQLYAKCNISSQAELFAMMMPLVSKISGE